jgi:uncharacterized membrane protein
MKNLRKIQYVLVAILVTMLIEGIGTLGLAFDFSKYDFLAYVVQIMIYSLAVIIALRLAEED